MASQALAVVSPPTSGDFHREGTLPQHHPQLKATKGAPSIARTGGTWLRGSHFERAIKQRKWKEGYRVPLGPREKTPNIHYLPKIVESLVVPLRLPIFAA